MKSGIYQIRNTKNNKCYIGSSQDIDRRFNRHLYELSSGKHHNIYLQRSWNKYGPECFSFEILEIVKSVENLFERESFHIDSRAETYNLGSVGGGDNISKHPKLAQIKKKHSDNKIHWWESLSPQQRKEHTVSCGERNPNWKGGISNPLCPSCKKRRISSVNSTCVACRDRSGEKNPFYGRKHSDETKVRISKKLTGKRLSKEQKDKMRGENSSRFSGYYHTPWGIFASSSEAEKENDILKSNTINTWCKNSHKTILRLGRSDYLKHLGEQVIGKTYRDIGFYFEPAQK